MKTILLTGARAPVTLDLARSFHEQGYRVIAAESMSYPLSRHSRAFSKFYKITAPNVSLEKFKNELISIITSEKVDLLIPTCEEAFHLSRIKDELSKHTTVLIDHADKLEELHSKYRFNQLSVPFNFLAPKSYRATSGQEAISAIEALPSKKVVLKPEFSRFASKTLILDKASAKTKVAELSVVQGVVWVIQECIEGPEYCTYSLAVNGKLVSHVTYDHEFTAGRGAGICFQAIDHPAIEAWVRTFVQKNDYHGQLAFDFIEISPGKVLPLECNPRATSGLHLVAQNPAFIDALVGKTTQMVRPDPGSLGQLRLAMVVYGLASINSFKRAWHWLKVFFTGREVVFSVKDPAPFFDQFISFFVLIVQAKRKKITALEVSTQDIEWNGKQS
jgi:predicted ATP-grasp superfamily ATP-dependent carboligase